MESLWNRTRFIMKKYGIDAQKSLGQNFLIDENVIEDIVDAAAVNNEDLVIEIGPGIGALTEKLLERAGKVICIELDTRMLEILNDRFYLYKNFELINNDVLKVDLQKLINENLLQAESGLKKAKIVANLPYYITTPIIMKILEEKLNLESITVMIQKEVADRITAVPGDKLSGAITYSVYYFAESEKVRIVEKNSFIPEPKVQSEVIKLKPRKEPVIRNLSNKETFFKVIKASFMQRRKTLVNALVSGNIFETKEQAKQALNSLGFDENVRGESLTIEDFAKISNAIK